MPLPFIAGLAIGSGAALLFTKRKTLKKVLESKNIQQKLHQGKEISLKAYDKLSQSFKNAKCDLEKAINNKNSATAKKANSPKRIQKKDK
ncbi:hypothetical protein [Helicobacter mesocricetorum]|uniref:hypothetical protein n=1 Tax=Helicobacter mesocricetorum TaxID=87012 RepID=UPI000CF16663|nr:hypothetical protein [Helicobacter mesocricetorum]